MGVEKKIKSFPDSPGAYLMKDAQSHVIYVGKALSLRKRVASYFSKSPLPVKTRVMLSYVQEIDYQKTSSEHEALLLESELIKRYQPRFNISLKDDKSYPYVIVTREEFPRVFIGRKKKARENADYFGPYTSAKLLRRAVKILRRSFPFRTCRSLPSKPCLHKDLKLCCGPCKGTMTKAAYLKVIRAFEGFLAKRDSDLIDELSSKIRLLAYRQRFEEAARLRDQLEALSLLISLKKLKAQEVFKVGRDLEKLKLSKEPLRIEAFDISHIQAHQSVGSMASFYRGQPDKSQYRRFKIRGISKIDDYEMMREVVRRRYERLNKESRALPDLIVIDGGLGHLGAVKSVLKDLKLKIPVIAIAKKQELIYTVHHKRPIHLEAGSEMLRLIQSARDEAHRFALKYHRSLRGKDVFRT